MLLDTERTPHVAALGPGLTSCGALPGRRTIQLIKLGSFGSARVNSDHSGVSRSVTGPQNLFHLPPTVQNLIPYLSRSSLRSNGGQIGASS